MVVLDDSKVIVGGNDDNENDTVGDFVCTFIRDTGLLDTELTASVAVTMALLRCDCATRGGPCAVIVCRLSE